MKLPRFSLKTMLVIVALCAVVFAWFAVQERRIKDRSTLHEMPEVYFCIGAALPETTVPWYWRILFGRVSPAKAIFVDPSLPPEIYQRAVVDFPEADVRIGTEDDAMKYVNSFKGPNFRARPIEAEETTKPISN